jgi:hypothetical protein
MNLCQTKKKFVMTNNRTNNRGRNFTDGDVASEYMPFRPITYPTGLLDLIQELLPRGANEWDDLTSQFNQGRPQRELRDKDALRNKFNRLKNHSKPTGCF